MKNIFGVLTVIFFIIPVVVYGISFFGRDLFSGTVMIAICIVLPIIGLILGILSKGKGLKLTGIIGNSLILLVTGVIPLVVRLLFWNQP
ncbi:hypothetical protein [Niallia sp. Man26]|uniref:hypothetical protein n=1 Tax=Niallia sp. Man26 TaxID=2912824 RepID=UPI001EDA0C16|nr:hypothetical protein [Niallia sp. Man26]UPO88351.1 hypothetical protein L8T27_004060 [Niallia sp. Man26]